MTRMIGKFDFDDSVYGVRFTSAALGLSAECLLDSEIDTHLQSLKDDLDGVARRMKAALTIRPPFTLQRTEPGARFEMLEAR